ncbi:competence type IV pilus ATPase ComGA [Alteribacillus sp. YIM 98480]|uniref:competence type IV pilus ATPase ComGA n=1 Tax=Alteribacillus sp. YIM 98480 TaxID=2606599 RepID=UPI00131D6650|nr:competence type IV pilus ATPase ComGA [Alteribacillus sp. YIM 98480]
MTNIEWESRKLIERALSLDATDIHLHPNERSTSLLFRLQGKLHHMQSLKKRDAERLIAHFKFRAGMDIGEQRRPQNGSFMLKNTSPPVNLRFSTIPAYFRESLSIRLLPQNNFFPLSSLSNSPAVTSFFYRLLTYRNGMIILTGPTGSGKTTTLYAFMNALIQGDDLRVISIEDPVEIRNENVIQTEINEKAGLTYTEMLKASLRHDPDALMVGEIRGQDTAYHAIRAAYTGHLVFTTMHASSPYGAIKRLIDFGFSPFDLQETLLCITSQFLIARYCPLCKSNKCSPYCGKHGMSSRIALFDILAEKELKNAIIKKTSPILTFSHEEQWKRGLALGLFSDKTKIRRSFTMYEKEME